MPKYLLSASQQRISTAKSEAHRLKPSGVRLGRKVCASIGRCNCRQLSVSARQSDDRCGRKSFEHGRQHRIRYPPLCTIPYNFRDALKDQSGRQPR